MIPTFINFNGEILPADSSVLSILNRGFRYGDGLFESMRYMKGQLKFADLHAGRLLKGMKVLKLEGYSQIDQYFLKEKSDELAARNKNCKNARLRLTVFRDGEGLYTPVKNKLGYAIELQTLDEPRYFLNAKGLIMNIYKDIPKAINILSNYKTCNALLYVMAGIYKTQQKLDDAFILNQQGYLCESISSNLFVSYQNTLYTPALSEGCIAGVMRQVVIELAMKNNISITEAQISPEILQEADEVFLTNANRGIQWVMGFGRKRYFNEMSKLLINHLNKL
ncbi:MAG: aminotransferase class IV [Sphingobacteriaceae bacterium]